ncbi:sensor histidine kinase [Nocardioides sp. SYSU D00065]|uniref:sensor histidine kinase n=1 Tax=Nocardioides sp. SYSU D00065 TaxID=2817378 RepID=UPI001B32BEB2|nr:histidine kinase [Nocardioides sp. SYSU D00065]
MPAAPRRADIFLLSGVGAWAAIEAVFLQGPGTTEERLLFAFCCTAPLLWRRRWPTAVLVVVSVVLVARAWEAGVPEEGATPLPALLITAFTCAFRAPPVHAVVGLPIPLIAISTAAELNYYIGDPTLADYAVITFIFATTWSAGWLLRRRVEAERRALAATNELARLTVRDAVTAERERIARELHDVVAHSLSIVTMQAGAAQSLLRVDIDKADHHLEAVRRTSRQALVEMRRLLDVLHQTPRDGDPVPDLGQISELIEQHRLTGLPVTLHEDEPRPALAAGLGLAAYRIVQESLTNVRKHGGDVPTSVDIRYANDRVVIEVVNDLPETPLAAEGSGRGLPGMKERARLHHGSLVAGPREGRYHVRAELPLEASPA